MTAEVILSEVARRSDTASSTTISYGVNTPDKFVDSVGIAVHARVFIETPARHVDMETGRSGGVMIVSLGALASKHLQYRNTRLSIAWSGHDVSGWNS